MPTSEDDSRNHPVFLPSFVPQIELGFWFSTLHLVIGIILCVLGVLTIFVGWALGMKLRSIRRDLSKEDDARKVR